MSLEKAWVEGAWPPDNKANPRADNVVRQKGRDLWEDLP